MAPDEVNERSRRLPSVERRDQPSERKQLIDLLSGRKRPRCQNKPLRMTGNEPPERLLLCPCQGVTVKTPAAATE